MARSKEDIAEKRKKRLLKLKEHEKILSERKEHMKICSNPEIAKILPESKKSRVKNFTE